MTMVHRTVLLPMYVCVCTCAHEQIQSVDFFLFVNVAAAVVVVSAVAFNYYYVMLVDEPYDYKISQMFICLPELSINPRFPSDVLIHKILQLNEQMYSSMGNRSNLIHNW